MNTITSGLYRVFAFRPIDSSNPLPVDLSAVPNLPQTLDRNTILDLVTKVTRAQMADYGAAATTAGVCNII